MTLKIAFQVCDVDVEICVVEMNHVEFKTNWLRKVSKCIGFLS
jgi:hypothetical protein